MENVIRIALIDDDPICHLISSRMIKQFSTAEVETYTDPREALFQMEWRARNEESIFPDLILLDIDMPFMNGWEFLEKFQKLPEHILKRTDVIILSSSNSRRDVERSQMFKTVRDFYTKPLTEDLVRNLIQYKYNTH